MISRSFSARSLLVPAALLALPAFAGGTKLTDDDRIEILRGIMAEFATVKAYLPRSTKPLPFDSNGTWDKEKWKEMGREMGPAARVGDLVQVTKVTIESDKLLLEINGGPKRKGHWYDHVQVGMGNSTQPVSRDQNRAAATGTLIALEFHPSVPPIKAAEIKKILSPVLDFDKQSATEQYVEKLPEPVQKAIKEKKAIEGMDKEQVMLSLGKPRHKERDNADGIETEEWIYGEPPGKITFITFGSGGKVLKVKEGYADLGGSTAAPLPPR